MKEALKLHEAKFHREHPELFNGSPKQRGLAWEKYAAEGLNQTNPPPAESAPTPLAVSQPPVPPVSGSVSLLWPLLVLALGALGVFFFWRQGARRK